MKKSLAALMTLLAAACTREAPSRLTGYVEADLIYLAPQEAGLIRELTVVEGARVGAGDIIFRMDARRASYSAEQAQATAEGAAARASDSGMLAEQIAEAQSSVALARQTFARTTRLLREGVVTKARFDADAATLRAAEARLAGITAERSAAMRDRDAANAAASLAGRRLGDLETAAPEAGVIERIYRRAGEVVAAGDPVAALLTQDNLKVRFFAPEPMLPTLTIGGTIAIACDGCGGPREARIIFIASDPQFTPPVIYSIDERAKLVFLVEARPLDTAGLRPGQPVTIMPVTIKSVAREAAS